MELEAFARLFGTFAGVRLGVQSLVLAEFFGGDRPYLAFIPLGNIRVSGLGFRVRV